MVIFTGENEGRGCREVSGGSTGGVLETYVHLKGYQIVNGRKNK